MTVATEHSVVFNYNGGGAAPVGSGGTTITTDGTNRAIVILCLTSRENSSADINQVTAITASGLTFTRVFHDVTWTYSDAAADASFPVASHSFDVFTAPAAAQQTSVSFTGTMSGDGFVNHGTCYVFAVSGLTDINNPFDGNVLTPLTQKNVSGVASAIQVTGLTTTNANDLLVAFFSSHVPPGVFTNPSVGAGWSSLATSIDDAAAGAASNRSGILQSKLVSATQSGVTVPTSGANEPYWYGAVMAFAGPSTATIPPKSRAVVVC